MNCFEHSTCGNDEDGEEVAASEYDADVEDSRFEDSNHKTENSKPRELFVNVDESVF